jgi:hypothetical protein
MVEVVAEFDDFDMILHDVEIISMDICWGFNPHH